MIGNALPILLIGFGSSAAWLCAAEAAPSVDDIIAGHVKAIGGREKLDSIQTQKYTGTLVTGPMQQQLVLELKRPNKSRLEMTLQGMTEIEAFDGTVGWSLNPSGGRTDPQKMSDEETKEVEERIFIESPIVDYKKKGHEVTLMGKEDVEGTPAYKLKVIKKNGSTEHHYLDAEQLLLLKIKRTRKIQGTDVDVETAFGDYKPVEGLVVFHWAQLRVGSGPPGLTVTVSKVELNTPMPDERFAMPAPRSP